MTGEKDYYSWLYSFPIAIVKIYFKLNVGFVCARQNSNWVVWLVNVRNLDTFRHCFEIVLGTFNSDIKYQIPLIFLTVGKQTSYYITMYFLKMSLHAVNFVFTQKMNQLLWLVRGQSSQLLYWWSLLSIF